ncbi:DUF4381 domain-containing protein [Granulosicoccus sp.]|nr:DUF4381 domain-containing protein [Granulosicoccus sp.]
MAANPDTVEWLEQHLHDVHLPPDVQWWPPAPGWWMLALISTAVAMGLVWRYKQRLLCGDPRRIAMAKLDALHARWQHSQRPTQVRAASNEYHACESAHDYLRQCNIILRELAIALAGRKAVSHLTGNAWTAWLEHGLSQPLHNDVRRLLGTACYQRTVTADIENVYLNVQRVIQGCRAHESHQASHA